MKYKHKIQTAGTAEPFYPFPAPIESLSPFFRTEEWPREPSSWPYNVPREPSSWPYSVPRWAILAFSQT